MDENYALIQSILKEDEEIERRRRAAAENDAVIVNGGWQTVTNKKRNRKPTKADNSGDLAVSVAVNGDPSSSNVFSGIEQHYEERRGKILEAQIARESAYLDEEFGRSKKNSHSDENDDDDYSGENENENENVVDVKKGNKKKKKVKAPKVTVAEAASKINADEFATFLAEITVSYESQQDLMLLRFADYFGRVFASVGGAQFPWLRMFKESSVAKMVDIPLVHISEDVYKAAADWISRRSSEALGSFVIWLLDSILADLAHHQGATKGAKSVSQQPSSKSQAAIFVVLAMVLRQKPDVMISLLPTLKESKKFQGQDELPLAVWVAAQASQGDLVTGLFLWVSLLLPMLSGKSGNNPQYRDLVLQLVERILSSPKAQTILLNGAVRKGERVVSPSGLDALLRISFPQPSARVKATERFQAVYPKLKEVALAGSPGSKAMKQLAQQISNYAFQAAGEANPDLSREASAIFIWCLTQNPECYKQWDMLYMDNLEASVAVLTKLSDELREYSPKHPTLDPLRETLKSFRQKNEKALAKAHDGTNIALLRNADQHCKAILRQVSKNHGCMKSLAFLSIVFGVGAIVFSQNIHSWDQNKLAESLRDLLLT